MSRGQVSLPLLRTQADLGVARLVDYLGVGRGLGMSLPPDDAIHARMATATRFDIAALSSDSRRLVAAHRAVADHLHHLPEQQVRLDRGWQGETAGMALGAIIDHQRRAESDLHVLRTLGDATSAAASGIDRLLRTFLLATARLADPTPGMVAVHLLSGEVLAGRVPPDVVIADIASRLRLFVTGADTVIGGITEILTILNRSTEGLDDEPYPIADAPRSGLVRPATSGPDPLVTQTQSPTHAGPLTHTESLTGAGAILHTPEMPAAPEAVAVRSASVALGSPPMLVTDSATSTPVDQPVRRQPAEYGDVPFRLGPPVARVPDPENPVPEIPVPENRVPEALNPDVPVSVPQGVPRASRPRPSEGDLALAGDQ